MEERFELEKQSLVEKMSIEIRNEKDKEFAEKLPEENEVYHLEKMKKDFPSLGSTLIDREPCHKPFAMISGHPYSGTTILNEILGQHPDVYPFWDNVVPFGNNTCSESLLFSASHNRFMPEREVFKHLADVVKKSFGKKIVLEKTPSNIFHLDRINMFLSNVKFVCMVRDGRNVIGAKVSHSLSLDMVESWANSWLKAINIMEQYMSRATNMMMLRLEDLTADSHATLHEILEFIGLGHSPEIVDYMLRYHERSGETPKLEKRIMTGDKEYGTGFNGVQSIRAVQRKQPLYKDTSRWRKDIPVEFWPMMYEKIGPTLERLGYVENAEQSLKEELERHHAAAESVRELEQQLEEKRRTYGFTSKNVA
jgi:hypothetical protein